MDSYISQVQTSSPHKYWFFIGGALLLLALIGISIYFYFNTIKKSLNSPTSKPSIPSISSLDPIPSRSPMPSGSPMPSPNPYISIVSPCSKYEDDTGSFCSEDGVKAYNNALSGQLNYICQANGKKNQYDQCVQMCQNGQFKGLPMCRSCCLSVCSSMVCPPVGRDVRGGGEAGGGKSECATICRLKPNSEYCQKCNKA